jgi:predicted transcriptional regulator
MLADERGDWHPMGDRPDDTGHGAAHSMEASPVEAATGNGAAPIRRAAGQLEAAALDALQRAGSALSPSEVRERIGGELAYTTVVTILSRLHAKGMLSRYKDGRVHRYAPVADQPGLAARRMARVLDEEADREAVLARFVSSLSDRDEELLRKMLAGPEQEALSRPCT